MLFKGKKRADLQLSIRAIVVLIIAIVFLVLVLALIKSLFGKSAVQLGDISEGMKSQMIAKLKESGERLTMNEEDIKMLPGETREIYFAVRNVQGFTTQFNIQIECTAALENSPTPVILDSTYVKAFEATRSLQQEIDVQKMTISVPTDSTFSSHPCTLYIERDPNENTEYAKKSFYVTVVEKR